MSARATEADVKGIIDTTLEAENVTPFLRAANVLVTDILASEGYGATLMTEIETWLAAHFVAVRDPRVTKENFGDAGQTFEGKTSLGLNGTRYGQQVLLLDHHGRFAQVTKAMGPATFKTVRRSTTVVE